MFLWGEWIPIIHRWSVAFKRNTQTAFWAFHLTRVDCITCSPICRSHISQVCVCRTNSVARPWRKKEGVLWQQKYVLGVSRRSQCRTSTLTMGVQTVCRHTAEFVTLRITGKGEQVRSSIPQSLCRRVLIFSLENAFLPGNLGTLNIAPIRG